MRQLFACSVLLALMPLAHAQVGPAPARVISRPMPSKAPSGNVNAEADLLVNRKGGVDLVEILASSGDPAFDKQWKKSMSDWRFVPAVGADGVPAESNARVTYRNNGINVRPATPGGTPENVARNVIGESERLEHLTCKDFLWEYEIVTDALPRRLALLDPLLKTPQVMLAAEKPLTDAQQAALRERYDDLVNDAVKQCRDAPDTAFWSGIFKPLLQTTL